LAKDIKPLTPLLVQSEYEIEQFKVSKPQMASRKTDQKENLKANSEIIPQVSLKDKIKIDRSLSNQILGENMFMASPLIKKTKLE